MLRQRHTLLYNMGSAKFRTFTGCDPPCVHSMFKYTVRKLTQASFFEPFKIEDRNVSGIGLNLYTTNKKIVSERFL